MRSVEQMDLESKVGQMLLFGWPADDAEGPSLSEGYPGAKPESAATTVNAHLRRLLTEWRVGGLILMGRNVESPRQVAALTRDIQALSDIPVFVSTDQEGGHVCRMKTPFTMMPGAMPLGATRDEGMAFSAARAVGEELSAIGITLNFAPDADVNNNPDNPIIGVRSFGSDPRLVADMVAAQVKGYTEAGIICCAKHFPGHGDTAVDSHLGLAHLPWDLERLHRVELPPFKAAIAAGAPFIMTAHIVFEALDAERPATLSPRVVDGLLRGELGFDGCVITDCMEMRGVISHYGIGEAAVMAVEAGVDILAACHTPSRQEEIRAALLEAVRSGRLSEDRINLSARRILACKERYGLADRRSVPLEEVDRIVGSEAHREVEREIARKSITVVKDEAGRVPLPGGKIAVIGPADQARQVAECLHSLSRADVASAAVGPEFSDQQLAAARDASQGAVAAVILTKHQEPWTMTPQDEAAQAAMVNRLVGGGAPVVVVALRNPYDLRRFPDAPTYLCTYGYTRASLSALAEVLEGASPASGRLPVEMPIGAEAPAPVSPVQDTTEWGF